MRYILVIALLATMLAACDDDTKVCDMDVRTEVRTTFRYTLNDVVKDTTMPEVSFFALGKDSLYRKQTAAGLQFPLDRNSDSSKFYLKTGADAIADTLIFRYSRRPHFVSAGCGFATYFTIDTVETTAHTIRSVQIINQQVTTTNETHLYLHY